MNLLYDAKIIVVEAAAVAGTTELVTDVVDTSGFDSIAFIAVLGDVTSGSVLGLVAKSNTANSVSSPTPVTLEGAVTFTAGASDVDSKTLMVDIMKPRARYVFASLTRTTQNAVVNCVLAVLYNAHSRPVTIDASMIASSFTNDPDAAA